MTTPQPPEIAAEATLLREQWLVLRDWLETKDVLARGDEASGIGTWTVDELVAHLAFGLHMVAEVGAAHADPIPLVSYVAGYAQAGTWIAAETSELRRVLSGRLLEGVDALVNEAWQALDDGLPDVVQGRRGPLRAEDFVLTRLIELVAHGDDLHRVVGDGQPSPLLPAAVERVADCLAKGYLMISGQPSQWHGLDLVRVATGRVPVRDPAMPLLS